MGSDRKIRKMQLLRQKMTRLRRKLPLPRTWQLQLDIRRIDRFYKPLIATAAGEERQQLDHERYTVWSLCDEELRGIFTDRLRKKANRLYVPIPSLPSGGDIDEDENWERGYTTGIWSLKPEGAEKVRKAIYEEKKRQQEIWLPRITVLITVLTALVGLIGALTGLVAVWTKN